MAMYPIRQTPFYVTDHGAAYLGDALQLLRDLPDECVNLIVTSPPYALHFKKEYGNVEKHEYVSWFLKFSREFKRVLTKNGSLVINIGGSYANIGTSELVLKLKPGINEQMQISPKAERGALFEMAAKNIPTIHLLYVRGLALQYGLPWDPIPLPKAGESELLLAGSHRNFQFWIIIILYFLTLLGLLIYGKIWMKHPNKTNKPDFS